MAKTPWNRFILYLCETLKKHPWDPEIADMDHWERIWWYYSWMDKLNYEAERLRMHGILIGSFANPEAAQKMLKKMDPDVALTDEESEEQFKQLQNRIRMEEAEAARYKPPTERLKKRRVING